MTGISTEVDYSVAETTVIANKHVGSSFDSFLEEEGIKEQVHEQADARTTTSDPKLGTGLEFADTTIAYEHLDVKCIMDLIAELKETAESLGGRGDSYGGDNNNKMRKLEQDRCDEIVKEIEKLITGN